MQSILRTWDVYVLITVGVTAAPTVNVFRTMATELEIVAPNLYLSQRQNAKPPRASYSQEMQLNIIDMQPTARIPVRKTKAQGKCRKASATRSGG